MSLLARRRTMLGAHARLPKEYQEVEWVESCYDENEVATSLLTNYEIRYPNKASITIRFSAPNIIQNRCLIGFGTGSGMYFGYKTAGYVELNGSELRDVNVKNYNPETITYNLIYKDVSNGYVASLIYNGVVNITSNVNYSRRFFNVFYVSDAFFNPTRVYFAAFGQNQDEAYFVPCYRKSDNLVGFYDIINNAFIQPTAGKLLKGADV